MATVMYTMKDTCELTGLSYETLKFYCKIGLIPNVVRNKNNHRMFTEANVGWIKSLTCLKNCNMSIAEMKKYLAFCLEGPSSIPDRKVMLAEKKELLLQQQATIQEALDYIAWKEQFYDDIQSGKIPYVSNLIDTEKLNEQIG